MKEKEHHGSHKQNSKHKVFHHGTGCRHREYALVIGNVEMKAYSRIIGLKHF